MNDGQDLDAAVVIALADALASMEGKLNEFRQGLHMPDDEQPGGHADGYIAEAHELMRRLDSRGITLLG